MLGAHRVEGWGGELRLFFEGSEKKVEVIIDENQPSLRGLEQVHRWESIVQASKATVISSVSNEYCDAYLLSESSLFVFPHKFVMITCGQTDLLNGVKEFLKWVSKEHVEFISYERKNEHFPDQQPTSWARDIEELSVNFPGETQVFGDENNHHILLFHHAKDYAPAPKDTTLEILMHDLDREVADLFYAEHQSEFESVLAPKIRRLLPDFVVDDFSFDPMGYSLNAINGHAYFTIHVTPQDPYSYISFETNLFMEQGFESFVRKVLELFKPKTAMALLFCPESHNPSDSEQSQIWDHHNSLPECGYQTRFSLIQQVHSE